MPQQPLLRSHEALAGRAERRQQPRVRESSLGYDYMRFDVRGRYFMFSIDKAF